MARTLHQGRQARPMGTPVSISRARCAWEKQVRYLVVRRGWRGRWREGRGGYWELAMRVVRPFRTAFTLVELMVVITVIAIVTSVMVLEMGGSYEDALLRSNARKLIDVCDAASNRAIAIHQAQALRINTTSGKFFVKGKLAESTEAQPADQQVIEGELD